MAIGISMYLRRFDKRYKAGKYNVVTGEVDQFVKRDTNNLDGPPTISGNCKKTAEGWAAVYGHDNELFFQIKTKKWNLSDKDTRLTYSTLDDAYFKIEDDNSSFEIRYPYWMEDALLSDLDDDDSEHDFFAYVMWLREPENSQRIAEKWSRS